MLIHEVTLHDIKVHAWWAMSVIIFIGLIFFCKFTPLCDSGLLICCFWNCIIFTCVYEIYLWSERNHFKHQVSLENAKCNKLQGISLKHAGPESCQTGTLKITVLPAIQHNDLSGKWFVESFKNIPVSWYCPEGMWRSRKIPGQNSQSL